MICEPSDTVQAPTKRPEHVKIVPKVRHVVEDDEAPESDEEAGENSEEVEEVEEIQELDAEGDLERANTSASAVTEAPKDGSKKRKRKNKDAHDDLEEAYMKRLEREEDKEVAKNKAAKASVLDEAAAPGDDLDDNVDVVDSDDEVATPPPMHETLNPDADAKSDMAKSQRTVFLGNVSTSAIKSKTAQKTLMSHLSSFFSSLQAPATGQPAHSIESIRFRSTAYATAIPKKAAFAKKELMDATTQSTNAYVIYSSQACAREAARRLNGTVVLDRHLRVDEVAHPAKIDHKRCVFVGNLGFVDDESNIDEANAAEGREQRKGKKEPSDVEEGLWRTFGKCGTVESVRVIRDSKTRVGKGIAYVQFTVSHDYFNCP